jgi:hypothetical protein
VSTGVTPSHSGDPQGLLSSAGGYPGAGDLGTAGKQWTREASQDTTRRFSVDASGGSGLPLHLQGVPRMSDGPVTQMKVGWTVMTGYRGVCLA